MESSSARERTQEIPDRRFLLGTASVEAFFEEIWHVGSPTLYSVGLLGILDECPSAHGSSEISIGLWMIWSRSFFPRRASGSHSRLGRRNVAINKKYECAVDTSLYLMCIIRETLGNFTFSMDTYAEIVRNRDKYDTAWRKILSQESDRIARDQNKIRRTRDGRYAAQ